MRIGSLAESVLINFLTVSVSKASFSVLSDLCSLLWNFSAFESGRFSGIATTINRLFHQKMPP